MNFDTKNDIFHRPEQFQSLREFDEIVKNFVQDHSRRHKVEHMKHSISRNRKIVVETLGYFEGSIFSNKISENG